MHQFVAYKRKLSNFTVSSCSYFLMSDCSPFILYVRPDRFLGDQRSSYNQDMQFTLRIGEQLAAASVADVVIQGAGMEVSQPIFGQGNPMPGLQVRLSGKEGTE